MLPLFPLQAVFFPGSRMALQVFEARYLDLMSRCLRDGSDFGIVWLREGSEVRRRDEAETVFATVGVRARIDAVDMPRAGLMHVALVGGSRFGIVSAERQDDGLWVAETTPIDDDPKLPPAPEHAPAVSALRDAFEHLRASGQTLAEEPQLDDASWVSMRCCEMLPLSMAHRQTLMEMKDPLERLTIIMRVLAQRGAGSAQG
jgi:uncharacterized protein